MVGTHCSCMLSLLCQHHTVNAPTNMVDLRYEPPSQKCTSLIPMLGGGLGMRLRVQCLKSHCEVVQCLGSSTSHSHLTYVADKKLLLSKTKSLNLTQ